MIAQADDSVQRSAELVADVGDEFRSYAVRFFGETARFGELADPRVQLVVLFAELVKDAARGEGREERVANTRPQRQRGNVLDRKFAGATANIRGDDRIRLAEDPGRRRKGSCSKTEERVARAKLVGDAAADACRGRVDRGEFGLDDREELR